MTIRTEVFRTENVPVSLRAPIHDAYLEAFPNVDEHGIDINGNEWAASTWQALAWEEEAWGGIAGVIERTIDVGGREVRVGGIGGVMTLPALRGKGLGKAAMRTATDLICGQLRADAGMLYCVAENISYYAALGWFDLQRKIIYQQSDGVRVMDTRGHADGCAMFRPCGDFVFPHGPIDVRGQLW